MALNYPPIHMWAGNSKLIPKHSSHEVQEQPELGIVKAKIRTAVKIELSSVKKVHGVP